MREIRILLVDDEEKFIEILKDRLIRKGYNVTASTSSLRALDLIKEREFDVALFDIMMPNLDGIELLEKSKKIQEGLQVVMLTGYGTIETAIEAMKKGAYDYLTKPIKPVELELVLKKAADKKRLQEDNSNLTEVIKRSQGSKEMIGESKCIMQLKDMITRVADSPLPVLILGESGTGKELVAQALHYQSCRGNQPFVPINASAIPNNLLESELFGHVRGAFTGAQNSKKGLVELANGGTLFLDEIGDMDPALQVKLLRFIDTGEFRPVGDTVMRKTKVRIVTATNLNLQEEIKEENFREDLYYRLSTITMEVPPLRARDKDVLLLAEHFLRANIGDKKYLSPQAKEFLTSYHFPGNVRELVNFIERGILMSKGREIRKRDLFSNSIDIEEDSKTSTLKDMEKEHINHVLKVTKWDKPLAAEKLNIALRTLYRKIKEYELVEE